MKPNTISLNVLIDSSASTDPGWAGALNSFVDDYRLCKATLSFFLCHEEYQPVYWGKPIEDVGAFRFEPEGNAALFESACRMIDDIGASLAAKPEEERPEQVVVVFVTNGCDRVSAPQYTQETLLAKIREQSDVYRWQFVFHGTPAEQFQRIALVSSLAERESDNADIRDGFKKRPEMKSVDVIPMRRQVQKTSYQFSGDIHIAVDMSMDAAFETAVDTVRGWVDRKLLHSRIPRENYFTGFDLDVDDFGQQYLNCVSLPDDGQWCLRLVHPDNPDNPYQQDQPVVPGRTWTTDISIYRTEKRLRFSLRVFCVLLNADDPAGIVRPRLVPDLADALGLIDGRLIEKHAWSIDGENDVRALEELLLDEKRQLPVVLLLADDRTSITPEISQRLFVKEKSRQSMQAFAHVAVLPRMLDFPWGGVRDDDRCEVRICFPSPRTHVLTLRYDESEGVDAIVASIKEELMIHATTKKMDWGGCQFYNTLRSRKAERRRKEIMSEAVETETVRFYEYMKEQESRHREEVDSLRKELEESYRWVEENENKAALFEQQLDRKKQEYYVLYWRLKAIEEKSGTLEIFDVPEKVFVSKTVLKSLERIRGEAKEAIKRLISRVGDPAWRQIHHHAFSSTDLLVFKPGNTPERIAGFLKEDVFHVTHVYDHHETYEKDLQGRAAKDWENVEYVAWREVES